jgi:hypothetical protein
MVGLLYLQMKMKYLQYHHSKEGLLYLEMQDIQYPYLHLMNFVMYFLGFLYLLAKVFVFLYMIL